MRVKHILNVFVDRGDADDLQHSLKKKGVEAKVYPRAVHVECVVRTIYVVASETLP